MVKLQGNVEVLVLMDIDRLIQSHHCDEKQDPG